MKRGNLTGALCGRGSQPSPWLLMPPTLSTQKQSRAALSYSTFSSDTLSAIMQGHSVKTEWQGRLL